MKTQDRRKNIAGKSAEQIRDMVKEKRESLRVIRFGGGGAKVKDVREVRSIRRDIARALTAAKLLPNKAK